MNNNLAISVFHIDGGYINPLHISKAPERRPDITHTYIYLLLHEGHYSLIAHFSRLVRSQLTSHKGASLFCYRCISAFSEQSELDRHEYFCRHHTPRRVTIPNETVKFKNPNRSMPVPMCIIADFESYIKSISTCAPSNDKSYTKKYQQHIPNAFAMYAKPIDEILEARGELDNSLRSYIDKPNGGNVGMLFVKHLQELVIELYNKYEAEKQDMIFTSEDELSYNSATHCHICDLPLKKSIHATTTDDITVRDHCHITGKCR
jgi:hypothetical protein